jgi:hypothetical protein
MIHRENIFILALISKIIACIYLLYAMKIGFSSKIELFVSKINLKRIIGINLDIWKDKTK